MRRSARILVMLSLVVLFATPTLSTQAAERVGGDRLVDRVVVLWETLVAALGQGSDPGPDGTTGTVDPGHEGDDGGGQMDPGGGAVAQ